MFICWEMVEWWEGLAGSPAANQRITKSVGSDATSARHPEQDAIWSESDRDLNYCSVTHMARDGVVDA